MVAARSVMIPMYKILICHHCKERLRYQH
jgi:hypothetical protein